MVLFPPHQSCLSSFNKQHCQLVIKRNSGRAFEPAKLTERVEFQVHITTIWCEEQIYARIGQMIGASEGEEVLTQIIGESMGRVGEFAVIGTKIDPRFLGERMDLCCKDIFPDNSHADIASLDNKLLEEMRRCRDTVGFFKHLTGNERSK